VVYHGGVEWAIKSLKPYKAPGTDGIYPILIQKGLDILLSPLTKAFRASIALKYVPQAWGATKVLFIPKPGRMAISRPETSDLSALRLSY